MGVGGGNRVACGGDGGWVRAGTEEYNSNTSPDHQGAVDKRNNNYTSFGGMSGGGVSLVQSEGDVRGGRLEEEEDEDGEDEGEDGAEKSKVYPTIICIFFSRISSFSRTFVSNPRRFNAIWKFDRPQQRRACVPAVFFFVAELSWTSLDVQ